MLIILEGPDGSGKSTLARHLEAKIRAEHPGDEFHYRHAKAPTEHPLNEYLRPLTRYRPGTGQHYVIDRWHRGEYVYPRLLGRETKLDHVVWWSLESYLRRLGALVVSCGQFTDEYERVYRERGELEQYSRLLATERLFNEAHYDGFIPTTNFNWKSPRNGSPVSVFEFARQQEEYYTFLNPYTTYLGGPFPQALLVGDVRHGLDPASDTVDNDPAFMPFRGTSGYYLLSALAGTGLRNGGLGIVNGCDRDDVVELWARVHNPPMVALGRNACRRLCQLDVPHGTVPHPQYVRRFHSSRTQEYGELIKLAFETEEDYGSWPNLSQEPLVRTSTPARLKESASRAAGRTAETVPSST